VRFIVRLLGCEVFAIDLATGPDPVDEPADESVQGLPFGFSGGAMCQAERGDGYLEPEI
jgi:hypothetical protein